MLVGAVTLSLVMASVAPMAVSQQCNIIEIWVDPAQGEDIAPPPPTNPPTHVPIQINNPNAPTKTIQFAIDLAFDYLKSTYHPNDNPDQQAVVHLLPGIYGPDSAWNGEHFPIVMRDRVHVRGVSARRCVIRGVPPNHGAYCSQLSTVFWPSEDKCGVYQGSTLRIIPS